MSAAGCSIKAAEIILAADTRLSATAQTGFLRDVQIVSMRSPIPGSGPGEGTVRQQEQDNMSSNQILGIALLAAGIILLYFGYQASQSVGEQVLESFTGRFTDSTTWYLVFGAAASLGGLGLLILRR